ncbi:MAG TPA: lipocalin-like domain-containing protein [Chondromyces sp.]|nr:lipocalin-like domain-containing protein [Chondromyces sp.]
MSRVAWALAAAFGTVGVAAVGSEAPSDGWLAVSGPPELELPRDHGAHPGHRTEWWYLTGLVESETGERFGFQLTFFRQGLAPGPGRPGDSALRARQVLAAHLAVADIGRQRFLHAERLRRADGGLAGFATDDLELWLDDWRLERRADGALVARARDAERELGLELELRLTRELVRHGDLGYSQKGPEPGNASAYLSWTRLLVAGQLEVGGKTSRVRGTAWFDHEWGTSQLGDGVVGWDWFSLRLDDGRDLMVYRLRRADGSADPFSSGTLVDADGEVVRLGRDDVAIVPRAWWTSPATGARYPVRWRLEVPSADIELDVRSLLEAAELDGTATTGVVYWEGPVAATGSAAGEGYAELTGYAGSLEGRF